ncbi:hypothetical protein SLOPH_1093, partial [Spraguea lophii 42_110]
NMLSPLCCKICTMLLCRKYITILLSYERHCFFFVSKLSSNKFNIKRNMKIYDGNIIYESIIDMCVIREGYFKIGCKCQLHHLHCWKCGSLLGFVNSRICDKCNSKYGRMSKYIIYPESVSLVKR